MREFEWAHQGHIRGPVAKKNFQPKFPQLPVVPDYKNITSKEFWDNFPTNLCCPAESSISGQKLKQLAATLGCSDLDRLERVVERLINGADIGCEGPCRAASRSSNSPDSYVNGREVSDAVASWIVKKFAFGPVDRHLVPAHAKISGIMTRVKPDGSVRVILNLSAPKGRSVNDGIDAGKFPAVMSSTAAWVEVLNRAGKKCNMIKVDFSDAYKHVAVRQEDTDLQWFSWGGKFFKELCLVFGSASSAGIFDETAKVILDLACRRAKFDQTQVCQHLDDIVAAAPENSGEVQRLDAALAEIAEFCGAKLAPRDNPEKSFAASTSGVIFGVHYDTKEWTWCIPQEKLTRLLDTIEKALVQPRLLEKEMKSLAGKLINIKPLIPAGKYNIGEIMKALADSNKADTVVLSQACRRQLSVWRTLLLACQGKVSIPQIPDPFPCWAITAHCDAAGGSLESIGRGSGGVCGEHWFYFPWSKPINAGEAKVDGKKVARKLSALELVGPLILITALSKHWTRQPVRIFIDNAGSVGVWKKGYSNSCRLSSSIVMAIAAIAAGIGARIDIAKEPRCSSNGAVLADALSKAKFTAFRAHADRNNWRLAPEPLRIPVALVHWLQRPAPDHLLGHRILSELALETSVLGYSSR